jgi:uncharacterized membrane protein (GlpM family)
MVEAGIIVIKLLLGLAAFLLVGYVGKAHDKRIAGVLLTFPILNGIAMLTSADPLAVAQSIYPLVIFNSLLFCAAISLGDRWPSFAPATPPDRKLVVRLVVWTAIWLVGAVVLTLLHDRLGGAAVLFVIALGIAIPLMLRGWTKPSAEPSGVQLGHVTDFLALWSTPDAVKRIALFLACFAIVLVASYCFESKWVGMASALPLPGLFALATLSVLVPPKRLYPIRDTVLLGPFLVIPFNWGLARAVLQLPGDPLTHAAIGIVVTGVFWTVAAAVVIFGVPALAARIDRWRGATR